MLRRQTMQALLAVVAYPGLAAGGAWAQEAPSGYVDDIESPGDVGGTMDEVDAERAQAEEAFASGEPATGLSRRATSRVEEIVVQARKRTELLEDTPVSVTALGADTLREVGVTRLDDIQELVPNLQFQSGRTGVTTAVRIRGIGTASPELAFDPGVGIYVDGIYLPRALGQIMDVIDVEQIEVLRGPQGTLFGKNTVGGAINMTTVKPHEELEAFALVRPGNLGLLFTEAMVNVPLIEDWLFSRLSFSSNNNSGYFENTAQDFTSTNRNSLAFLGSLRLTPHDDVTVDVSGSWARDTNHSRGTQCVFPGGGSLEGLFAPDLEEECQKSEPFRGATNVRPEVRLESYGIWGVANWSLGPVGWLDEFDLKALGSWRTQKPRLQEDIDGTTVSVVEITDLGLGTLDGTPGYQDQYSGEFQVNGAAWEERINFVAGYFAFWEKGRLSPTTTTGPTPGGTSPLRLTETTSTIDNWTWALYTQATVDVTEWMSITGGLRYTEDKKGAGLLTFDPRTPDAPPATADGSEIFTKFSPMGSLALEAPEEWLDAARLDHLMAYFTYAQGFRGGGFNALTAGTDDLASFGPETLDSYEVGFKTIGWDQRVTFNLALFLGEYDDIQVVTVEAIPNPDVPGGVDIVRLTQNAADATSKGIEMEMTAIPLDGLQLTGSVGILDAKFGTYIVPDPANPGNDEDFSGDRFGNVPQLQTYLAVQYSFAIEAGVEQMAGWLTPRLERSYQSRIEYGGDLTVLQQRGVNLLHARLSYAFYDDRAQVALWARNLTDEEYFNAAQPLDSVFGASTRYYAPPRTFGGEISYRF